MNATQNTSTAIRTLRGSYTGTGHGLAGTFTGRRTDDLAGRSTGHYVSSQDRGSARAVFGRYTDSERVADLPAVVEASADVDHRVAA
ncbi:hypothetical protein [Frondihabitans australicus]|uniref:Uncharacterized protein n=1 Tax=Frondihabitans australicus TaxID=386892 RepID=A0A495II16_9MICO|nr:hypothetical protein [Frondihabitans australicus]RKR75682.1 hypothetical protein C8E83_2830 [Frondihabitans australicus]